MKEGGDRSQETGDRRRGAEGENASGVVSGVPATPSPQTEPAPKAPQTASAQHPTPSTQRSLLSPVSCLLSPTFYLPLLFALYPIISLYSLNQRELPVVDLGRPVLIALISVVLLGGVFRLFSRDRDIGRSSIALSFFFLAFFLQDVAESYVLLPFWKVFGILPETALGGLWNILCLSAVIWILRTRHRVSSVLPAALIAGVVLIVPPLSSAVWKGWRQGALITPIVAVPASKAAIAPKTPPRTGTLPDLYCIVLDGYGRQDVLERMYGVDNEPFLHELEKKGFFIARQSRANYIQTALAMDAALNGDYLETTDQNGPDLSVVRIGENRVTKTLQKQGFRIVYVPTTFPLASVPWPDIRLETKPPLTEIFTPLERLVLEKTPFEPLMIREYVAFDNHRLRLLAAMEDIKTAATMQEPKFVLAHILAPHPPFVFGPHGEAVYPKQGVYKIGDATDYMHQSNPDNYREGYANQVRYLNQKLLEMVEAIQRESTRPAVIVLMGDHGPRSETDWKSLERTNVRESFYNLVAVAAPAGKFQTSLTNDITPINLFRLILTDVYSQNLPRLPDKSYYSTLLHPYHFTEVTDEVAGAEAEKSRQAIGNGQ